MTDQVGSVSTGLRSMLVTGGAAGIGAAIAHAAVLAGYRVGIIDPAAGSVGPDDVQRFACSITDEAAIEAVLDSFGTPDVVVNNAGIVRFGPLLEQSTADMRAVLDVNLLGTFVVSRATARRWVAEARPGAIVNLSYQWCIGVEFLLDFL